jgi:hypothetical protein
VAFLFHMCWLSEGDDPVNVGSESEVVPWQNANDVKQ